MYLRPPKETYDGIKDFLEITGRKINNKLEENNQWILEVQQGASEFKILHPLDKPYVLINFGYEIKENEQKILANTFKETNLVIDFNYALLSAISSPHVYCSLRKIPIFKSDNIYTGFDITKRIFPIGTSYPLENLEDAIQNVVSAGSLGIYFFATKLKSCRELVRQVEELNSSPEGMFI